MAISFVESTLKSTTWGVRIDTDLIFLSIGNVSVQNLPSDTILSMINPRLRSTNALISYSVWDFIFSKKITEAQFNNLLIMFRGILKIQLSTNPETLEVSDFVITGLPGGVTLTTVQRMSTTGVTSLWQLGFSRILTQSELDGLGIAIKTESNINIDIISLVYDNGITYLSSGSQLYTLNSTTSQAVSTNNSYGTNILNISLIDNTTYGFSQTNQYTINISTGTATSEGTYTGISSVASFAGLGKIGSIIYAIVNKELYTVNLSTRVFTNVQTLMLSSSPISNNLIAMATDGTIIWAIGNDIGLRKLFTIDTTSGSLTQVGSLADGFGVNETNPAGLSYHNSNLYMIGNSTDRLYTLNITTGAATEITTENIEYFPSLQSNQILRDQPETISITYLRIRLNANVPSLTPSNLNIQGLPSGVTVALISKESSGGSGTGYSIWDIRFSRNLTADETRRLVITVTGALDSGGRLLDVQPLLDQETTYINPLSRLPAISQSFFDGVRALLFVGLEESDLSNETIALDAYLGSASRYVAAYLKLTDQSMFDSYTAEYKARVLNAIQNRVAAMLVPALPQILTAEILESEVKYALVDWEQKIQLLLRESGRLLSEITPEEDLYADGVSPFTKTGKFVAF